jgi:hypothetical protein
MQLKDMLLTPSRGESVMDSFKRWDAVKDRATLLAYRQSKRDAIHVSGQRRIAIQLEFSNFL